MNYLVAVDASMDAHTSIGMLKRKVSEFRDARNWLKNETPRSLAISISIEAAELLEHFQWKTDEQMKEVFKDEARKQEISDELADVLIYSLGFADVQDIDISDAVDRKLRKNSEKYPVPEPKIAA